MRQVVAGSGKNTIHLALLSTGINEEYIKVFWFPSNTVPNQSVVHYLQLMENPTAYATHTKVVAANQLIILYNIHVRLTFFVGQPYPFLPSANTNIHVTYYIATSTIPRTVLSIP